MAESWVDWYSSLDGLRADERMRPPEPVSPSVDPVSWNAGFEAALIKVRHDIRCRQESHRAYGDAIIMQLIDQIVNRAVDDATIIMTRRNARGVHGS